ncbi:MAG: hypothetical protein A3J24_02085 [Deltaproteobacteria bacterium RIFCSPLOWO2_02_FULL_53_8]|nr:MAG: hypothetical protein A3J24_02085 [Deltaproteobacteria bacterium RIFCSPLOWO2_02_FULL_53_8]
MSKNPSDILLDTFATTTDSSERVRLLTELMTIKALPKQADDSRFGAGMEQWIALANSANTAPRERLLSIAELIRGTQQLKKRQPALVEKIRAGFTHPLPPLAILEDPEARLNVARACSMLDTSWLQEYRASSIANETAPKPRAEMMEGIVSRAGSIAEVIDLLSPAFAVVQPGTENPAESMAKRLTKTLEVFRITVLNSLLDAGPEIGNKLDAFIKTTLSRTGRPQDQDVQFELTREVALTLHDLVRSRFSLSTEPQTFLSLQYCRTFFTGISWPKEVRRETDLLVQDVSEALVMLGRMGVPNQDLLNRLDLVCGIKERARSVAIQLAEKHNELDESIRSWLRTGRMISTIAPSEVLQESLLSSVDEALGLTLIEARSFNNQSDVSLRLITSLEIFDPSLVPVLKSFFSQSSVVISSIEDLAKRRELDLLGGVGEEMEFSPKYFDALGPLHGTRVLVRRPAIVKKASSGTMGKVVKKGLVE